MTRKQTEELYKRQLYWANGLHKAMWDLRAHLTDEEWAEIKAFYSDRWRLIEALEKIFIPRFGKLEADRLRQEVNT